MCKPLLSVILAVYPEVQLLDFVVAEKLAKELPCCVSVALPFYVPNNSPHESQFFHFFAKNCYFPFFKNSNHSNWQLILGCGFDLYFLMIRSVSGLHCFGYGSFVINFGIKYSRVFLQASNPSYSGG